MRGCHFGLAICLYKCHTKLSFHNWYMQFCDAMMWPFINFSTGNYQNVEKEFSKLLKLSNQFLQIHIKVILHEGNIKTEL
jgi:hypothetical protein